MSIRSGGEFASLRTLAPAADVTFYLPLSYWPEKVSTHIGILELNRRRLSESELQFQIFFKKNSSTGVAAELECITRYNTSSSRRPTCCSRVPSSPCRTRRHQDPKSAPSLALCSRCPTSVTTSWVLTGDTPHLAMGIFKQNLI